MSMRNLETLQDMLCDELDEIAQKGEMSAGDLDTVHKLTDTIKNIDKIMMLEDGEYSRAGEWEADMRGTFGDRDGYRHGNSYTNRGRHYVRGHYSRDGGREQMIRKIEDMMQDATGTERDAYKRAVEILRKA